MSDFFKKFLLEDPRRLSQTGRYVGLAAFGKHPGWDDHVEDLGLETGSLNLAKTVLYVNGIGGQIDSGAWEKLDAAQQLPTFHHLFVWQRSGQILIGRLWSSSDGKGRKRYPMVVCLHFTGVTLGWALKQALPALAELEDGCTKTTSAEDVRALLNRKRAALREAIQSTDGRGEYAPVTPEALNKILRPAGDAKSESFLRVLYQLQSQLGAFAAGRFNAHANPATVRAQQIRVPVSGENPEQALLFWTRFFLTHVDDAVPLLLTLPLEAGWVDVTVGEPESHEFFCLRASPKAVPLVSEVPYNLDDAFRAKAAAFLDGFQRGETTAPNLKPAAAPVTDAPAPAKGGLMKWLGVGVILVIGAVATVVLLPKGGKPVAQVKPAEPKPEEAKPAAKSDVQTSAADDAAKVEAARAKAKLDAETEAARLAEEKKKSDAMAAAAKLKTEAEAAAKEKERQLAETAAREKERQIAEAAAKEKERQIAEAARLAKEKETARQKELAEQQRKEAEAVAAKKKADEQAQAKVEPAPPAPAVVTAPKPAPMPVAPAAPAHGEMTNSIGMVLVELPSGLWVGKYEVTQAEYRKVMGANPSKSPGESKPVEQVTWNDANDFCRKLTVLERGNLPTAKVYSLPTEKQWEEFRAGQKFEDLPGGVAGRPSPSVVGQAAPANKFGLFDVLGNVYEWCLDDATSGQKVLKGGAYNSPNYDKTLLPDKPSANSGFRCVIVAH